MLISSVGVHGNLALLKIGFSRGLEQIEVLEPPKVAIVSGETTCKLLIFLIWGNPGSEPFGR